MENNFSTDPDLIDYVANLLVTKAGFSFSPWTIGGAYPFFRPRWVFSFEVAEDWDYDSSLLAGWLAVGPGYVLLDAEKGDALWHQFEHWSREAQGGLLQKLTDEAGNVVSYAFRPDSSVRERIFHLIRPRKSLVVARQEIVRPGGIVYGA